MNIVILHNSKFGNGLKCAEVLSKDLCDKGHSCAIIAAKESNPQDVPVADFYIIISATYIGGPSMRIKRYARKMNIEEGNKFIVIATGSDQNNLKTISRLENILTGRGLIKHIDGIKIFIKELKSGIEENYEERLKELVKDI